MATTTEGPKANLPLPPFAEHDKLGPLGTKTSVIDSESELRRALVAEFLATAEAARDAAAKVDKGAQTAVHEYRKALRRARAVLELVAGALPKSERRAVRRALQEARRAVSVARDHAVAPEALAHIPLGEVERETAAGILATAADAMPPIPEIKQLLAEGAARAAAQVEALEAALPAGIEWSVVLDGVRSVYSDARRAHRAAKRSKRSFHTWRRRSKELTYQLELIAAYAGVEASELHREIEGATETQGPAVDLIMVRDFIRTYGPGVAPEAFEGLMDVLGTLLDDLMKDSRSAGKDAYSRKPRKFVRRLAKAVRHDLAPVEAPEEIAGD